MLRAALVAAAIAVGIAAAPIANAAPNNTDDIYYPNCAAARQAGADLQGAAGLQAWARPGRRWHRLRVVTDLHTGRAESLERRKQ